MKSTIFAIDFDGTFVTHEYPIIGKELENAINVVLRLQEKNKIILYTMRSGKELQEAVDWCQSKGIKFYGVNENPSQHTWTASRKVYAHMYIDDAALGVPLDFYDDGTRPSVNWFKVEELLKIQGYL